MNRRGGQTAKALERQGVAAGANVCLPCVGALPAGVLAWIILDVCLCLNGGIVALAVGSVVRRSPQVAKEGERERETSANQWPFFGVAHSMAGSKTGGGGGGGGCCCCPWIPAVVVLARV